MFCVDVFDGLFVGDVVDVCGVLSDVVGDVVSVFCDEVWFELAFGVSVLSCFEMFVVWVRCFVHFC